MSNVYVKSATSFLVAGLSHGNKTLRKSIISVIKETMTKQDPGKPVNTYLPGYIFSVFSTILLLKLAYMML